MGKGSCKKKVHTKEQDPKADDTKSTVIKTVSYERKNTSEEQILPVDRKDHNANLINYTQHILKNPMNQSLTKQHITLEMAKELVNVRTADNVGLGHCISANYKNPRSKFPYAVSPDSYCVFCDFFGPLIDDYHGHPREEAHFEPRYGNLQNYISLDLNTDFRQRIIYSDIVVRRNIGGYPFTPLIKEKDRKEIIRKLEPMFRKVFENEKEVAEIPIQWVQRFDSIKNDLDDIEAMRNYPSERLHLIFESTEKTNQGIVLNFDDHLQIITSRNDGKIGLLYNIMYDICTNENLDNIDFIVHPVYGFLTVSPAYVGTGMTVRIIAKLPFLSRLVDLETSILKKYEVTIEAGGAPCAVSGILTISNRYTFNKTEEEILNDVVEAFHVLCELEDELELTSPMAVQNDVLPVESLYRLTQNILKSESKGYTKKYLTQNIINEYESVRTSFDNTLSNCIRPSAYFAESMYPRAADGDCYTKYRLFFAPILYETNKIRSPSHSNQPDYGIASNDSVHMLHHRDILSYRVRFVRNFEKYPFPMSMSNVQRKEVEQIMLNSFEEFPVEIEGEYCRLCDVNDSIYFEKLLQYNLLPNFNRVEVSAGCYRNWPQNRGFFFAKNNPKCPDLYLVIFINITEHIKVICLDPTGKTLYSCYDRAVKVMRFLDLRFGKIFSKKLGYGFLTSFPQSVGCGLRISAWVYLKNLGDKREIFERICKFSQFAYRGTKGSGTPAIENVFDISLKKNMNVTEKWILITFCQQLKELLHIERTFDSQIPYPHNNVFTEESVTENDYNSEIDSQEIKDNIETREKENIEIKKTLFQDN